MKTRRFLLRLAVGLLCFAVGWASAVLLGVTSKRPAGARRAVRVEVAPHAEAPDAPPMPFRSGCRAPRLRHAYEWHDLPRHEELDVELPPGFEHHPAPPPPPARSRRHSN